MLKNILVIENNINQVGIFKQYVLSCVSSVKINKICLDNSKETYDYALNEEYDILIINYDLDNELCDYLFQNIHNKKVILICNDVPDKYLFNSKYYHPDYYIKPNYTVEILTEIFFNFLKPIESNNMDIIRINTTKILHELGMPSSLNGFDFIREGIAMLYENKKLICSVTKELYPTIATKYNTLPSRVERSMRNAIEVAWNRGDIDKIEELFGNSINVEKSKPTNSEFMYTIADYLHMILE